MRSKENNHNNNNKIHNLSDLLSDLVDDINGCVSTDDLLCNKKIENDLIRMKEIATVIGGKVLEKFVILDNTLRSNGVSKDTKDSLLILCVDLKNQLWEL